MADPHRLEGKHYHASRARLFEEAADEADEAEELEERARLMLLADKELSSGTFLDRWVDIKAKRSWSDKQKVSEAGFDMSQGDDGRSMSISLYSAALKRFDTAIVDWNLQDEDGKPLPVSLEGFEHDDFDADFGEWLSAEIEEYYRSLLRTEEEDLTLAESSMESSASPEQLSAPSQAS